MHLCLVIGNPLKKYT